ncbi:MAG TPA: orotidine-5'-phosphate decarboxylase [Treponemataceae bacterium]|nr:orotidine-5'-phosphate decarboxylase [Treponemataceae bacterium]
MSKTITTYQMRRLQDACAVKGPLCCGLDTDPSYVPPEVLKSFKTPSEAVLTYNLELIKACAPFSACFKVQIAYYEAMGLEGMHVYVQTLEALKKADIPIISDIKRGDIAATATAYARAHFLGDFETDIVTLNPYMGFETLNPFVEFCKTAGKGAFVLLRTSNPGVEDLERLSLKDGGFVLDRVGDEIARINKSFATIEDGQNEDCLNDYICGPIGAVVGCTEEGDARQLRDKYPHMFFLIPGYGVQGGAARLAASLLDKAGGTVNSSRGILCAWKQDADLTAKRETGELTMSDIVDAAAKKAQQSRDDLLQAKAALFS